MLVQRTSSQPNAHHARGLLNQLTLGDVTSLVEITEKLSDAAGKTNDALGASEQQRKEARAWLAQVEQGSWNDHQQLKVRAPLARSLGTHSAIRDGTG